ncbi:hypothetical protein [Millionella massiliensis]|uniref:hypothetical protein n=1 Tax=Millionella massiliensis TaxID=1871023 RepID=UPI0008D8E70F|nr:hypothetical protein [Millionella massiliensis]
MIKTYKLIKDINLTTPVRLGNSIVMISFAGGSRNTGEDIRRGWFTTGDEALQQALEADSGYGRVFRCITPVPKAKPEKPADESQPVEMQGADGAELNGAETEAAKIDDSQAEITAPVAAEAEAAKMDDSQAESIAPVAAEAEDAAPEVTGPEVVSGVTNKQQAIEWLAANRGIDGLKPTCRAEAVRNAAALHGVSFPDWK